MSSPEHLLFFPNCFFPPLGTQGPSLHILPPPFRLSSSPPGPARPSSLGSWEPTHTGLIPFELQAPSFQASSSPFHPLLQSPRFLGPGCPSCDLICHRGSPAAEEPPSIIWMTDLGFVDSWGFSLSRRNKPETSALSFPLTSLPWPDCESPGQGRCLYMPMGGAFAKAQE